MGSGDTNQTPKRKRKSRAARQRHDWRDTFISTLFETGLVTESCKAAGIARCTAYDESARNPEFAARWDDAIRVARTMLLDAAIKRARDGWEEVTITDGPDGVITKKVTKVSDGLLSLLLRGYFSEFRNDAKPIEDDERTKADPDAARAALDAAVKAAEKGAK